MNYLEENEQQKNDEQVTRGIGISFALHALVISIFTLKTVFFTQETIDFTQAVRVDMVGLPDKTPPKDLAPPAKENPKPALPDKEPAKEKPVEKPPEKVAEKKAEPKPEPVKLPPAKPKEEGVNLEKVKAKQQNALDKLKAMAALEKIKEDVAEEKKKVAANAGTGKADTGAAPIKGNVVSPGSSLTGIAKLQNDSYISDLDRHIKQNWTIPEWLSKKDYKAQVRLFIDSRGNILGRKIVKSSGNPSYDEEVLATIDRSAPFPAPPEKLIAVFSVDGILIGFPE
ncbi:TonB family protein [Bdellovibrio bacteriovorus]|uniref:TonB family protein n=1 Tax=Bdellovibrio bacteriovorus TaxID=959 RepID=UPI0021CFF7E0|nr:TonB family protein [Bdellovibrio bacteriovorus]UXR65582.1 TonB family protein [Bdellovibrio bacteriovorus]